MVIPACPLTLHENGRWSERHQTALLRYYADAGAGGVAVGVHTTQFAIRQPQHGLLRPLLQLAGEVLDQLQASRRDPLVRIGGVCGAAAQAQKEVELLRELGYHAALVGLADLANEPETQLLEHLRRLGDVLPVIGFYLQPAVGGRVLSFEFWRRACELESLVAIKIAPFNRYQTWDVVRAVLESDRRDVALYTGNDDNILADLLTRYVWGDRSRFIQGGLLGQWAVWTRRAVQILQQVQRARTQATISADLLTLAVQWTDANAAIFDAAHGFAGCIAGVNEVLRRQGLAPSNRCLDPRERLSPGQAQELDRVMQAYPHLTDDAFVAEHRDGWLE